MNKDRMITILCPTCSYTMIGVFCLTPPQEVVKSFKYCGDCGKRLPDETIRKALKDGISVAKP